MLCRNNIGLLCAAPSGTACTLAVRANTLFGLCHVENISFKIKIIFLHDYFTLFKNSIHSLHSMARSMPIATRIAKWRIYLCLKKFFFKNGFKRVTEIDEMG